MNFLSRSTFIAAAMLLMTPAIAPVAWAQTPAQMEYERQQREYSRQQEQQRQEQQRQQQIMNENARRQQEESRRLNAPTPQSQSPAPGYQGSQGYQGGTRQAAPRQQELRSNATAATAAAKWAVVARSPDRGGAVVYADPVTLRRSGNVARMWALWDFKTTQVVEGKRLLSAKWQDEYDCKAARMRNLSITGFSGNLGKGSVVGYGTSAFPWESVVPGSIKEDLRNFACGKR